MKNRLAKKKSDSGMIAAIQRAARHREAEVVAELAEVSERLTAAENKLALVRQAERSSRALANYYEKLGTDYMKQADLLTDEVKKMQKQIYRNVFASFALGAALGLVIGFMCVPG